MPSNVKNNENIMTSCESKVKLTYIIQEINMVINPMELVGKIFFQYIGAPYKTNEEPNNARTIQGKFRIKLSNNLFSISDNFPEWNNDDTRPNNIIGLPNLLRRKAGPILWIENPEKTNKKPNHNWASANSILVGQRCYVHLIFASEHPSSYGSILIEFIYRPLVARFVERRFGDLNGKNAT